MRTRVVYVFCVSGVKEGKAGFRTSCSPPVVPNQDGVHLLQISWVKVLSPPHPHLLGRRNQPPCRAVEGLREQAGRNIWETQEKNSSSPPVFLPYQFVQDFCFSIMSSSTLNPNVFIAGEAQATLLQSHTIDPTAAVFCRWRAAARQRSYYS